MQLIWRCNPSFVLLVHLFIIAGAQIACPSLPFPLISAVICVCLLIAVWSRREGVYCTECIHPGKERCSPPPPPCWEPSRRVRSESGGKIESGSERHCCHTHSAPSGWKEGQMSEVQSEKGLLRGRISNCCANGHAKKKKKQPICFIYILQNAPILRPALSLISAFFPLAQAPFSYFSRLHLIFQPHGQ